jgi:hypothetical protein
MFFTYEIKWKEDPIIVEKIIHMHIVSKTCIKLRTQHFSHDVVAIEYRKWNKKRMYFALALTGLLMYQCSFWPLLFVCHCIGMQLYMDETQKPSYEHLVLDKLIHDFKFEKQIVFQSSMKK